MSTFAMRIELNGPPPRSVYDRLHEALARSGFNRSIVGYDGKRYKLPDGMYVGNLNTNDSVAAHDHIKSVVNSVHNSSEVVAFLYSSSAWTGLRQIA
ncbi:hypothetical protein [Sphingomonas sp. GM_Shp_2]|uniref:hypothetical protein n=1 Tax=Sphingomonas sp. GM_Shp_2 TaxID=2937380 RepID=UPI00226A91BF|nr:hypothetical protein [Sphingomonas sp. GM_Shp_2]